MSRDIRTVEVFRKTKKPLDLVRRVFTKNVEISTTIGRSVMRCSDRARSSMLIPSINSEESTQQLVSSFVVLQQEVADSML